METQNKTVYTTVGKNLKIEKSLTKLKKKTILFPVVKRIEGGKLEKLVKILKKTPKQNWEKREGEVRIHNPKLLTTFILQENRKNSNEMLVKWYGEKFFNVRYFNTGEFTYLMKNYTV